MLRNLHCLHSELCCESDTSEMHSGNSEAFTTKMSDMKKDAVNISMESVKAEESISEEKFYGMCSSLCGGDTTSEAHNINDPYAYIKDKGFTTEIFKIEIQNLPRKFGIQVLV